MRIKSPKINCVRSLCTKVQGHVHRNTSMISTHARLQRAFDLVAATEDGQKQLKQIKMEETLEAHPTVHEAAASGVKAFSFN
jgi:hypothetical protein